MGNGEALSLGVIRERVAQHNYATMHAFMGALNNMFRCALKVYTLRRRLGGVQALRVSPAAGDGQGQGAAARGGAKALKTSITTMGHSMNCSARCSGHCCLAFADLDPFCDPKLCKNRAVTDGRHKVLGEQEVFGMNQHTRICKRFRR